MFSEYFIKARSLSVDYSYPSCNIYNKNTGACELCSGSDCANSLTFDTSVTLETSVPFIYNYSCMNAVIKTYAPVYTIMFSALLLQT